MTGSFEEKSVWIQFFSMVAVLGAYFAVAGTMLANGVMVLPAYVPLFVLAVVLLSLVLAIGHILAAIVGRATSSDERDRVVGWRAESNSGWILAAGVLAAITCMVLSVPTVWIAHLLLLSLFVSEVVKYILQLVYYRRGM